MYYPIAIEQGDAEHCYGVIVPDLPGCFSAGDNFEEALENAKEAIKFHLETIVDDGEVIPLPSPIEQHRHKPEFQNHDFIWAMVEIDVSRYLGKTEKVNVTLPSRLIHLIDEKVGKGQTYKSRSAFLAAGAERLLRT